jgi:hypothetical protein
MCANYSPPNGSCSRSLPREVKLQRDQHPMARYFHTKKTRSKLRTTKFFAASFARGDEARFKLIRSGAAFRGAEKATLSRASVRPCVSRLALLQAFVSAMAVLFRKGACVWFALQGVFGLPNRLVFSSPSLE